MSAESFRPEESRAAALARASARLADAGIEEPQREARMLLCAALGLPLAALIARREERLGAGAQRLSDWLARRLRHEPLSRIRGGREFRGLWLQTSPVVLDPRPETELLIDAVLERLQGTPPRRLLDLGTGSGAILVSLLDEWPQAEGVAVDLSPEALELARHNARVQGVASRFVTCLGDLFEPVDGRFDLVVSNPPYIATADLAFLEPEVRDFDPALALDGGVDGLEFYRRILAGAPEHLVAGGVLALELGHNQAPVVAAWTEGAGFSDVRLHRDLAGVERHLTALWNGQE